MDNEISADVLDVAYKIHTAFGPGLLESVYEALLAIELEKRGHKVERQKWISMEYEGVTMENAFRLDLLIDDQVMRPLGLGGTATWLCPYGP